MNATLVAVVLLASAQEWAAMAVGIAVAFAIGMFGTAYYAIDPGRAVPARWFRERKGA